MKRASLLSLVVLLTACATVPADSPSARLNSTPRHDEWVEIARGSRTLHAYVSYPERSTLSSAVILIHENRGLTDWIRSVADRLSESGHIVIAPDLLSGAAPGGGKTSDFSSEDAAREAISKLPRQEVMADLEATAQFVRRLPSVNGKIAVAGFCWGGARAFEFANQSEAPLFATYVFYGTGPIDAAAVEAIDAPVFGFYGGNDARVNSTIPKTEELMKAAGKQFAPVIYEGAGHAFLRAGEAADASAENRRAAEAAWKRWIELLSSSL